MYQIPLEVFSDALVAFSDLQTSVSLACFLFGLFGVVHLLHAIDRLSKPDALESGT